MDPNSGFSGRLIGLDALRAIAALSVVVAHSGIFFWSLWPGQLPLSFLACFGVDLFFVLSGFLVGGILIDAARTQSNWVMQFWLRRWWRTLPSYYLFVLINFILVLWLEARTPTVAPHLFFVQNLAWTNPTFFPEAWSLAIEEWFYLLAPILFAVLGLSKAKLKNIFLFALAICLLGIALRIFYVIKLDPSWDEGVKKIVLMRVDAIAWGLCIAALIRIDQIKLMRHARLLFFVGLSVILSSALLVLGTDHDHDAVTRILSFTLNGLGAALILPAALSWSPKRDSRIVLITSNLALWSYALYLVHLPIMRIWLRPGVSPSINWITASLSALVFIVLSIIAAALVYRIFERPVLKLRDRILVSRLK